LPAIPQSSRLLRAGVVTGGFWSTASGRRLDDVVSSVGTSRPSRRPVTTLCRPGGHGAFGMTRSPPEVLIVPSPGVPGGSLNGRDSTSPTGRATLAGSGAVQNLGRAATAVALSATHVRRSSPNGPGDAQLSNATRTPPTVVVEVYPVRGAWTSLGRAADTIPSALRARLHRSEEARAPTERDEDSVIACCTSTIRRRTVVNTNSVEEFVCNDRILAFRTSETAQGDSDLEGTGVRSRPRARGDAGLSSRPPRASPARPP